ncbi:MAG: GIY-YIG nuclease family protein [Selenomonadaceae bacterium]|nr:GIY-YIG nuclease family protein [Selenomonadaceae bacterium]
MEGKVVTHARYGKCRVAGGWFVAVDVARILGYVKGADYAHKHVEDEDTRYEVIRALDTNHTAKMLLVNERGLNAMLTASGNVESEAIKAWLLSAAVEENAVVAQNLPRIINDPDFGQFRWVMIDGVIWFVAADMCRILGFADVTSALRNLDDDEKMRIDENGVTTESARRAGSTVTPFMHELNVVNEYGVYRLIVASKKPEAKAFQRKLYHEILPAINKYGYYSVKPTVNAERIDARVKKQLTTLTKSEFAVVYILFLSNLTVKIGYTTDLTQRIKQLQSETGLTVLNFKTTAYMTVDEARALEAKLKEKYKADCIEGEYYETRFTDIIKEL